MASGIRPWSLLRHTRSIRHAHPPRIPQCRRPPQRGYAKMLSSPARAEYTFGMSWQIITPLLLLGTGSVAMIFWYFSSNEFLDAGFPPRAAEAFRIASVAAEDWQLRHAIRYWRTGLEIAIAHGISPFDDRILAIKARLMDAIKKEGDIGEEKELLEEIRQQALQEVQAGNSRGRGKLISLAVQAGMSLANMHRDHTEEDNKVRYEEFAWAIKLLQQENQFQRSFPATCPTDHWGWIPGRHDRVKILTSVGAFADEIQRPSLALTYYLEALPVYPRDNPDSLDTMLQIGRIIRKSIGLKTPFEKEQLVRQADIWLNRIISTRERIPRNLPPSEQYVKTKGAKEGTYTLWGWDRQCDLSYVSAIWEVGMNKKVLGKNEEAERLFDKAMELSDELKLTQLHKEFKKARLEMQGKVEEARNPYFWG